MCLAVPMKILQLEGTTAHAEIDGVSREVSVQLIDNPQVGDYIIVHAGFAIEKVDPHEARETLVLMRELAESNEDNEVR